MAQEASHLSDSLGPFDCPCHSCSQQGRGVFGVMELRCWQWRAVRTQGAALPLIPKKELLATMKRAKTKTKNKPMKHLSGLPTVLPPPSAFAARERCLE